MRKELSFELDDASRIGSFQYSMVMFHHEIPYAVAYERGKVQSQILEDLTAGAESLAQLDPADAETAVLAGSLP